MSHGSHTRSVSPAPFVETDTVPFGALLFQSSIKNTNQISAILRRHDLAISSELPARAPASFERSCHAPRGNDMLRYAAWSQEHLRTGALLPLRSYFKSYLDHMQIALFHLQLNGYRMLTALKSLYYLQHWGEPSPSEINYFLAIKKTPPRTEGGVGFYYLASWAQEKRLFEDVPNKPKDFKSDFFWTGGLGCIHSSFNRTRMQFFSLLSSFIISLHAEPVSLTFGCCSFS